tara:strand:- start:3000 stop:8552 length:5553 start_codon:yes stop_codon:yes gene_type:complete
MDPRIALLFEHLDRLIKTAIEKTIEKEYGGVRLLDYVNAGDNSYLDLLAEGFTPREDGLLVYGPYDLESVAGKGSQARNDLSLAIEPIVGDNTDELLGFRLSLRDQSTVESGGLNPMRKPDSAIYNQTSEIFFLELGEFSTLEEANNLFTKTVDVNNRTAIVSLVGDKLDEIFPNSTSSIEMALSNKGPVISERIRTTLSRNFAPDYIVKAMEQVDKEQYEQYGELLGEVEVPDTVEAAAADVVPDNISQLETEFETRPVLQNEEILQDGKYIKGSIREGQVNRQDKILIESIDDFATYSQISFTGDIEVIRVGEGGIRSTKEIGFTDDNQLYIWHGVDDTYEYVDPKNKIALKKFLNENGLMNPLKNGELYLPVNREVDEEILTKEEILKIQNTPTSLEDDVAEVNNDFVYEKFKDRQNTADNVIFKEAQDGTVELLVIKRKRGPHRDLFALPGGIVEAEMSDEKIIRSVVDPNEVGRLQEFYFGIEGKFLTYEKGSASLIFAGEALREAVEEVGLESKFIRASQPLPIKYNRYDWDARAANGVNVGGAFTIIKDLQNDEIVDGQVVSTFTEWKPKAADDALSYQWIKLEDVIDGSAELAFGHTEFVEDALTISLKNKYFNKSNMATIIKGTSVYDYDDVEKLKIQTQAAAKRNVDIINGSNVVREQVGQPIIPIEGNNVIDRQNKAMIDSIRQMGKMDYGDGIRFNAMDQMRPDFIFIDIMQNAIQYPSIVTLGPADIEGDVVPTRNQMMGNEFIFDAELTDKGKKRVTKLLQEDTKRYYRSLLKRKLNEGMQITPVIAAMQQNADKIINSQEFKTIIEESFTRVMVEEADTNMYYLKRPDGDSALYAYLDPQNRIIASEGIETAVDDLIEYQKNNYPEVGNAMESIRNKNNKFYKKTFPEEIYTPAWDYYKNNSPAMPEAMLDTKKLTRSADGNLSGIVYHGGNGLNAKGRKVLEILQTYLPATSFGTTAPMMEFDNTMQGFLNRITYENNIDWLDPTKYRTQQLRLNYMYTTSNPFVAGSYALGGHNEGAINAKNTEVLDAMYKILNHKDILDMQDLDLLDMLNADLHRIGLHIDTKDGENFLRTLDNSTALLIDPGVLQIKFNTPADSILHTDMPLIRQLKNPNVKKLLANIIQNSSPDYVLSSEALDYLIEDLHKAATGRDFQVIRPEEADRKVSQMLLDARKDGPERETIKNYYKNIMSSDQGMELSIKDLLKGKDEKNLNFSNMQELMAGMIRPREAIAPELLNKAYDYIKKTDNNYIQGSKMLPITPNWYHDNRTTAGHVLFTAQADEFFQQKRIQFEDMFEFAATQVDPLSLGSHQAMGELLFVQDFTEFLNDYPKLKAQFFKDFAFEVGYDYIQKGENGMSVYDDLLQDMYITANLIRQKHNARYIAKNLDGDFREFNPNESGGIKRLDDLVFESFGFKDGDRDLINFLNQMNGQSRSTPIPGGSPTKYADIALLKSLSQSGIEIVAGTGGGRVGNDFHDVFGIVDPGDKFGTGVARQSKFDIRATELDAEKLQTLTELAQGLKSYNDLDDNAIKAIAEFIPIQTIMDNSELTDAKKQQYVDLYTSLNINDERFFSLDNIDPSQLDGVFLQNFDEFREVIAKQSIFGDVTDNVVQNHATKVMDELFAQVPAENVAKVATRNGLLQTLGNGLDLFDAAVLAPVMLDMLISKTTGVGEATETIGGAVADVAQDIYDPTKTDTVFENLYGSPEDPGTLAGATSDTIGILGEAINPLVEEAKNNKLLGPMFDSIKEGAISALDTIKDGFGMNDWIYNVKRDMYVSTKLKEKGYNGKDIRIPSGLVSQLESEYEAGLPKVEDKYGRPLDVADSTNFPKYNPGRR